MDIAHVENLVFEGGGVKGIAFCGALEYLERSGQLSKIERVIGSSAGALYATLVAAKASSNVCRDIILSTDYKSLKDDGSWGMILGNLWRVSQSYGWCKGDAIFEWYGRILQTITGSEKTSFSQLFEKTGIKLVITATNLTKTITEYFSHLNKPNMEIRLALKASTCIPFLFPAVNIDGDLFVDGGMLNNYPIWYFDVDEAPEFLKSDRGVFLSEPSKLRTRTSTSQPIRTLGLKLVGSDEIVETDGDIEKMQSIANVKGFGIAIADALLLQIERSGIHEGYWERTVLIPTGTLSATDFSIDKSTIEWLIKSGERACKDRIAL